MRVNSSMPAAIDQRADRHRQARPDALRQRARPRREQQHQDRDGHQRRARLQRGVAQRELELEHDQEQRGTERGVHRERRAVRAAELRDSGTGASGSIGCELRASTTRNAAIAPDADETRHDLRRADPVVALDQRPARRGEADGREERAPPVDRLIRVGARLGHVPEGDRRPRRPRSGC